MDSTNKWYEYLYKKRKLSLPVIQQAGLKESNGWLEIPVFDSEKNHLFSKYRRPPEKKDGAKYIYDKGTKTSLYGIERLAGVSEIFIVEGELDVLAMRTVGREAVTSTGGAMSFKEEWADLFKDKKVTVLYDNDDAGISGAMRTLFTLGGGTFRWIPPLYGKDISDVLENYGDDKLLELLWSDENSIELDIPDISTKEKKRQWRKKLSDFSRASLTDGSVGKHFLAQVVVKLSVELSTVNKKKFATDHEFSTDKERAKQYPIENLLEIRQRKAPCPFHNEKTASFHIYKNNTGFCFGCRKYADPIDIAMVKFNLSFTEAVKYLNKQ